MKKKVNFFVSYAHKNKSLANSFLDKLNDALTPSKRYEYSLWKDTHIVIGDDWHDSIIQARDTCDFGLLLISQSFLSSKFIIKNELPVFTKGIKPAIPVMLGPIDFENHDLKGLEKKQIFMLDYEGFKEPRSYYECKPLRRETFILELFREIENKIGTTR